jgi:2-polyprenyl-3-methyl-5-hydroxy-6-metoxy-1,4-benzoquinol methylase
VNSVDRLLQAWRQRQALSWIPDGARVLDVGCFDGTLFRKLGTRLGYGVGIEPLLGEPERTSRYELLPGEFPDGLPPTEPFDVIAALAVLEHVPAAELARWAAACRDHLRPGGRVVATMPAAVVDSILHCLVRLRVLHGMETEQHHGLDPADVVRAFETAGFTLVHWSRFQLGMNNLLVLETRTT